MTFRDRAALPTPPVTTHRGAASRLALGSVISAALTWGLQAVAGRLLGPAGFTSFMVVWGCVFIEVGVSQGLQQEVTRAVSAGAPPDLGDPRPGRAIRVVLVIAVGIGALLAMTSPLWGPGLFGRDWVPTALAVSATFVAYALYGVVNGGLAGRGHWTDFSVSLAGEGVTRFVLVVSAVLVGAGLGGQAWGLAGGGLTWLLLLGRRRFRATLLEDGDVPAPLLARGIAGAMVASGCSAVLIAGFPVLVKVTSHGPLPAQAGVVLAAVVATRAPLLLPLNAFSAIVLTTFVARSGELRRLLARLVSAVAAVTVLGALLATAVGPQLLRLLYGDDFRIGGPVIGLLVVAAGLLAVQTLTGTALLSLSRHRVYAASWLVATAVAVAVLSLPLSVERRCVLALLAAPVVGTVANLVAMLRGTPPSPTAPGTLPTERQH